jgi:hypothetical protein
LCIPLRRRLPIGFGFGFGFGLRFGIRVRELVLELLGLARKSEKKDQYEVKLDKTPMNMKYELRIDMKTKRKDLATQLPVYAGFRTFKTQVQYGHLNPNLNHLIVAIMKRSRQRETKTETKTRQETDNKKDQREGAKTE